LAVSAVSAAGYGADQPPPIVTAKPGPVDERFIAALIINGKQVDDGTLVLRREDGYYVAVGALEAAKMIIGPGARRIPGPGSQFVALSSLPGVTVHFDSGAQELYIDAGNGAIGANIYDLSPNFIEGSRVRSFGGFLNYDSVFQDGDNPYYWSTYLDGGLSIFGGTLTNTALFNDTRSTASFIRAETAYTYDWPQKFRRLTLGDSISQGGDWGVPYRFGGLQYGTNFTLQPGYLSFPVPTLSGQAALPSSVDVYIDNALRYRGTVDQGPFALNQIPVVTGGGQATVVLTDPLGRQQSVTLPFYVSPQILKQGVSDFSYETGFLRTQYLTKSDDYGPLALSGTQRYGLTNYLTVQAHGEGSDHRGNLGLGATSAAWPVGQLTADIAGGKGARGTGILSSVGLSRTTSSWTVGIAQTWLSEGFDATRAAPVRVGTEERAQTSANAGISLGAFGAVSLSVAEQRFDNQPTTIVTSANWSRPITDTVFLNLYALNARQSGSSTMFGLTLSVLLDSATSGSLDVFDGANQPIGATLQAQHVGAPNSGWDYGAIASRDTLNHVGANIDRQTFFGKFGIAADRIGTESNGRLTGSGGFAFVDGRPFVAPRINDAFGVVTAPGLSGVTVLQDNRPIGKTDADGTLFLPSLNSNIPNKIGLEPGQIPITADVTDLDRTVIPEYRSPAIVHFNVEQDDHHLVTVKRADGHAIESGVLITRIRDGVTFRSGYDGVAYVDGDAGDQFEAADLPGVCQFRLPAPAGTQDVTCK
jgi:outer membrane usher protein